MRTRYRASQIVIDSPRTGGDVLINVSVQKIDIDDDGKIIHEYPRSEYIHRLASKIALNQVDITDPVNQNDITISIAGVHLAIEQYICNWLIEEHPEFVKEGDLVWES